jgi:hypothetical protein
LDGLLIPELGEGQQDSTRVLLSAIQTEDDSRLTPRFFFYIDILIN